MPGGTLILASCDTTRTRRPRGWLSTPSKESVDGDLFHDALCRSNADFVLLEQLAEVLTVDLASLSVASIASSDISPLKHKTRGEDSLRVISEQ